MSDIERSPKSEPTPSKADLARKLARNELFKFDAGEIDMLSTNAQLAELVGYTSGGALHESLQASGLAEERKKRKRKQKEFEPDSLISREGAWMLGLLSGGGYIDMKTGTISFQRTANEEVLTSFQSTGERLFGISSNEKIQKWEKGESRSILFNSTDKARVLGDLRTHNWAETVTEKHQWMLENPKYTWGFLEGFFDAKGGVYSNSNNNSRIELQTTSLTAANLLAEFLVKVGIRKPKLMYDRATKEE